MDGAAECADAAEMELGPGDDASGRDPLAPPCPDLRTLAESVMDLLWVTLTLTSGRITGLETGRQFEARCRDPRHGRCALTRADCYTYKSSGRLVGFMLAWMACDVATHTHGAYADTRTIGNNPAKGTRSAARLAWADEVNRRKLCCKEGPRDTEADEGKEPDGF